MAKFVSYEDRAGPLLALLKENYMATICLIGSARFADAFHEASEQLTLMGHIVLTKDNNALERRQLEGEFDPIDLEIFHLVHLDKIAQADLVFIIDGDEELGGHTKPPYIGESTAREILWAGVKDRILVSRQDCSGWGHVADLIAERYAIDNSHKHQFGQWAGGVLRKDSGISIINQQIDSSVMDIFHAGMSVIASQGGQTTSAYATKVLEVAGLDPVTDMPALMPPFNPASAEVKTEEGADGDDGEENSNLVTFARQELGIIMAKIDPADTDAIEMQKLMHDGIIDMVKLFSSQGHSGFSAPYAIAMTQRLLNYEPLSPLTGEDGEWTDLGDGLKQNKRCSRVFSQNGEAYDIEGKVFREPGGQTFTSGQSRVPVTFPYEPVRIFVDVLYERDAEGNVIEANGVNTVEPDPIVDRSGDYDQTADSSATTESVSVSSFATIGSTISELWPKEDYDTIKVDRGEVGTILINFDEIIESMRHKGNRTYARNLMINLEKRVKAWLG